ncbi:unnamed protein product [Prorocentrum cordatum]|uniref:Uncharacterized protein n=1 Tax=Prorocentrum cordatum TaxID=2364126 RepID=A0ABN9PBL4_9DINO|nr:unnamed protein product [Polarella glacialis]
MNGLQNSLLQKRPSTPKYSQSFLALTATRTGLRITSLLAGKHHGGWIIGITRHREGSSVFKKLYWSPKTTSAAPLDLTTAAHSSRKDRRLQYLLIHSLLA